MQDRKVVRVSKENEFVAYETVKLSDYEFSLGERLLTHGFIMDTMRKLMGRTLTIIDASTSGQQNKAMKDLIRGIFSDEMEFAAEWGFEQNAIMSLIPEGIDPEKLGTVSIEEALGVK
jgi:hypothetical protein